MGCIRSPIFIRKSFCIWTLPAEIYVSIVLVWRGYSSWIRPRCITNVRLGQCHIWTVRPVLCGVLIRNEELILNNKQVQVNQRSIFTCKNNITEIIKDVQNRL